MMRDAELVAEAGPFEFDVARVQQYFPIAKIANPVTSVTLAVQSNHGGEHTCVYRVEVHGSMK